MNVRRICAALLLLALLLGACLYALVEKRDQSEPDAAPQEETQQSVMVTDISVGSLSAAALSSGAGSTALMISGDQVILLDAPQGAVISDQMLKAFLYRMAHMPAVRTLGSIEDPDEYGFTDYTAAVALLGADGSKIRLFLGSQAPFDAGRYLMREGVDTLYLIDEMTAQMMRYGADDFRLLNLFPDISSGSLSSIKRIMLDTPEQEIDIYGLVQDGAVYFYMAKPYDTLLSWENVLDTLIMPLSALDQAAYVSGDVSPAKYGLYDADAMRLTTVIDHTETTLLFAPADEEHLYCAKKGGSDVVLVKREAAAFLDTQAADLMDTTLYSRNAADVDRVQVLAQGVEGEMMISGAGTMLRGMINGRTLDQAETVQLYDALTMLPPAQTVDAAQTIAGDPLLSLTFFLKDGTSDSVLLIPVSDRRCAVMINGEAAFATYTATVEEIIRVCHKAFGGR